MARPILVVRAPKGTSIERVQAGYNFLQDVVPDYHSLITTGNSEEFTFEVFNVQDYPQIDFEELKAKLENYETIQS